MGELVLANPVYECELIKAIFVTICVSVLQQFWILVADTVSCDHNKNFLTTTLPHPQPNSIFVESGCKYGLTVVEKMLLLS